jgi:RNA polymerase sigma factor (sigma-70 family)
MALRPFEEIVEEHGATVLRVCRALLDPHDAQDAWSETFVAALRAYPGLRPDSNVRGWLVTIAHRKAIDVLRARNRAPQPDADVEGYVPPTDDPQGADDALVSALRALPPKQRSGVVHHYLGDLRYRVVGELLGTSADAARRSAADGIAALRTTFARGEAFARGER